jgi:hypothetical protein
MASIQTIADFQLLLATAVANMKQLVAEYHGDVFLESILRQLEFVSEWTRNGQRPTDAQLKKLSFGVMADRAVSDLDPKVAQDLFRLANYLDHWQ